ncbi:MAG: hypothetical protein IPK19_37865 [Chloroflexi bacterium]|nr:hypothetical protein [Chloroflexota bacterium]
MRCGQRQVFLKSTPPALLALPCCRSCSALPARRLRARKPPHLVGTTGSGKCESRRPMTSFYGPLSRDTPPAQGDTVNTVEGAWPQSGRRRPLLGRRLARASTPTKERTFTRFPQSYCAA